MPSKPRCLLSSALLALTLVPLLAATVLALTIGPDADSARPRPGVAPEQVSVAARDALQRWSDLVRLGARNDQVVDLMRHPGNAKQVRPGVEVFLGALNELAGHGRGEVSVLDRSGALLAQVVGDRVTPADRLGADQRDRPFYADAATLPAGSVHQHRPYVSAQTRTWVISTSTPVVLDGQVVGLLEVEADLDALREVLVAALPQGHRARLVDSASGTTVADTARTTAVPDPGRNLDVQWLPAAARIDVGRHETVLASAVPVPAGIGAWQAEVVAPSGDGSSRPFLLSMLALALASAGAVRLALAGAARAGSPPAEVPQASGPAPDDAHGENTPEDAPEDPQDPGEPDGDGSPAGQERVDALEALIEDGEDAPALTVPAARVPRPPLRPARSCPRKRNPARRRSHW